MSKALSVKDCMKWPGTHRADGRPVVGKRYVYRITFEQRYGRLMAGQVLHHDCENVWCINPEHLVPMTQSAHNKLHDLGGDKCQQFKTHCPVGHPYSAGNLYAYKNERHCRECRREAKLRYLKRWRKKNPLAGAKSPGGGKRV